MSALGKHLMRKAEPATADGYTDDLWAWLGRAIGLTFVCALLGWTLGGFA